MRVGYSINLCLEAFDMLSQIVNCHRFVDIMHIANICKP